MSVGGSDLAEVARRSRPTEKADGMATLARGLEILDLVQRSGCMRIADLADSLEMPLSTAYRYVKQLRDARFLIQADGILMTSPRFRDEEISGDRLADAAEPILKRLRATTGLSAVLTIRVHTTALVLDVVRALPRYRVSFAPGEVRALHAGASVTPLLAFAPPAIVDEVVSGALRRYTNATPSVEEVRDEIARIRADGYAASHGQVNPGLTALGVPVLESGRCVCALSLVGPTASFEQFRVALAQLQWAADALTEVRAEVHSHQGGPICPV